MSTTTLAARPPDVRNLMVNMLPFSMTDEGLLALCSRYGEVLDCRVIKDRVTKEPRGYGFVTYTQVEAAQAAMQGLNGLEVGGQRLSVAPALGANSKKVAEYLAAKEAGTSTASTFVPRTSPRLDGSSSLSTSVDGWKGTAPPTPPGAAHPPAPPPYGAVWTSVPSGVAGTVFWTPPAPPAPPVPLLFPGSYVVFPVALPP